MPNGDQSDMFRRISDLPASVRRGIFDRVDDPSRVIYALMSKEAMETVKNDLPYLDAENHKSLSVVCGDLTDKYLSQLFREMLVPDVLVPPSNECANIFEEIICRQSSYDIRGYLNFIVLPGMVVPELTCPMKILIQSNGYSTVDGYELTLNSLISQLEMHRSKIWSLNLPIYGNQEILDSLMNALTNQKKVRELYLVTSSKVVLNPESLLEFVRHAPSLSVLSITNLNRLFEGEPVKKLFEAIYRNLASKLNYVKNLRARGNDIPIDDDIASVEYLDLSECQITDQDLETAWQNIKSHGRFKSIILSNNKISSRGIINLINGLYGNSDLEYLEVSANPIETIGAVRLVEFIHSQNRYLDSLLMNYCGINADFGNLVGSFFGTVAIKQLSLAGNPLSDAGLIPILHSLKANPNLFHLDLSDTHIGFNGIKAVNELLLAKTGITTLILDGADLRGNSGIELSVGLQNNQKLASLYLNRVHLDIITATLLLTVVQAHPSLVGFHFAGNTVDQAISEQIAHIIARNERLWVLNLNYCQIGDIGARMITVALSSNKSVRFLHLDGNNLSDNSAAWLSNSILFHPNLHLISLAGNAFSVVGQTMLTRAVDANEIVLKKRKQMIIY